MAVRHLNQGDPPFSAYPTARASTHILCSLPIITAKAEGSVHRYLFVDVGCGIILLGGWG